MTDAPAERQRLIEGLRELLRALDQRVPRPAHPDEGRIAGDSAALRTLTIARLEELEGRTAAVA